MPDPSELHRNDILADRYRVRRLVSAGGMGRVYAARDLATGARVALKLPTAERSGDQLRAEAERTRAVSDRHVIGFRALVSLPCATDCLVLDYANGGTLAKLVARSGRLPLQTVLPIALDVARGLRAIHAAGIVHLDVKPGNVLFARPTGGESRRRAILADFGLSRKTGSPTVGGTALYAAPEQVHSAPADPRADQYALGAVLFELLTGRPPHTGLPGQILAKKHTPAADPRTLRPALPAGVAALVNRMLAVSPDDRFADMTPVVESLERFAPRT